MHTPATSPRSYLFLLAGFSSIWLLSGTACVPLVPTEIEDGNVGIDNVPGKRVRGEPNNDFSQPLDIIFDSQGRARLEGEISTASDVDVYLIGPMTAGDRLIVDLTVPTGGKLDADMAIFDAQSRLAIENDDRDPNNNQLDPYIDHIIRYDSSAYYLGVTSSPLGPSSGRYNISITRGRASVPPPAGQIVGLKFDGGTIIIPNDNTYTVRPFDAANISSVYAGQTDALRQQIVNVVRQRYQAFNLDVRILPGDSVPSESASLVFFGARNQSAYGISQGVDPYNVDICDDSIVFTESFTPTRFDRILSISELGTAIGNVAAHEIGHLLGLNHVANAMDLMDTTGGAATLLFNQQFANSPLHHTIFPIGRQDGVLLLQLTIGSINP